MNRFFKLVASILSCAIFMGLIPIEILRAEANQHQEYNCSELNVIYNQDSTWNNSTQGTYTVENVSEETIEGWSFTVTYLNPVTVDTYWNVLLTDDDPTDNVIVVSNVSSNGSIQPNSNTSFGLIMSSEDGAPVAPISVTFNGNVEDSTVTPTPIPELPVPTEDITPTPTPTEEVEEITEIFPYVIFSGSSTYDFTFNGWKSDILGDIYAGSNFQYNGSELTLDGKVQSVGNINASGWNITISEQEENVSEIDIPNWGYYILERGNELPVIDTSRFTTDDPILTDGYCYVDGDIVISGTTFEGDAIIVASGDIIYNVNEISGEGRVLLYSENGDITINGTEININGIMYAPNGRVSINAYKTTLNGRIVCNEFYYSGSILNCYADSSDLDMFYPIPEVNVIASVNSAYVGDEVYFTIEISENNVYEILYRLNGETVTVELPENEEDTITYELNTNIEGTYTLEAYIVKSGEEIVLDSDTVVISVRPTPTPTEEPTVIPTETPTPTDEPEEYWVISEGDAAYGYEIPFQEEMWNISNVTTLTGDNIELIPNRTWQSGYGFYLTSRTFAEDMSFDARFTFRIDHGSSLADGLAFIVSPDVSNYNSNGESIGYGSINPSLVIEIDDYRNSGYHHNELGEGDWVSGESGNHIAVMLNGNAKYHYAYSEWPSIRTSAIVHDVWINYDGQEKILYVYTADYDEDGNVEKPSTPTLVYHIDLEEHFDGVSSLYMGFTSASGSSCASHNLLGFELDPMPGMHQIPPVEVTTQIGDITSGEPIVVNGRIQGTDSYVVLLDEDGNEVYREDLNPSGNYEQLFSIDTSELPIGQYELQITTTDANGETYTYPIAINIVEEIVTVTPTPTPSEDADLVAEFSDIVSGQEISFISDISGTVGGDDFGYYELSILPANADVNTEPVILSRSEIIGENIVVGEVDSTLLTNGYYKLILTSYNEDGSSWVWDEAVVLVTGQAKIGNYTISFLDMTLPVNGLPVEVYRTYDSRNRNVLGDFGYGWDMTIGGPSISVSTNLAENWSIEQRTVLMVPMNYIVTSVPHEIYVDWGNGHTETFTMKLDPERFLPTDTILGISACFENSSGTASTIEILDSHSGLVYEEGTLSYFDSFSEFNPQNFKLTTADGTKYYFNITSGLYMVEDTYGRTITIDDTGVHYSEGGSISINRDAEGKITSVEDGLGNEVTYTYDANGNLVSVLDYAGYTTTFEYDDNHYITGVIADNGTRIARNEYDDDGRLVATIDADGNRIEFEHNLDSRTEVTTNRLGYSTVYTYDERGNVLTTTDALGRVTTYTYDSNNNKTSETRPDGTVFNYTYDSNNDLISATDNSGRTITSTYGSNGELLTMSAMGVVELSMVYDSHGNITSATDSSGNIQEYGYSNSGELTSVSDSIGTLMNMTYDSNGNVSTITNGNGQVTNFTYDSEGRLTTRSVTYNGTTLTDRYSYDAANRVTGITYADGNTVSYTYNQAGDVISSTDSEGRITSYTYDIYGNLTRIAYPDGTLESFTYDAESQNTSSTDRMGRTSTYSYDAVGNLIRVTTPEGITCTYTYDACNRVVTATNGYGAVTTYGYDYLGRNTSVTDGLGNTTTYTYNDRGNVSSVTDANGNTYAFTYDNNGNQTSVTYPSGNTFSSTYDVRGRLTSETDGNGNTTTYSYNNLDRIIAVTDANGSTWNYTYDSMGNVVSVTDANGNVTTYGYDEYGRVISCTNAAGIASTNTYDEFGRVTSSTDFGGHITTYSYDSMDRVITSTTDGHITNYEYDTLGRVINVTDESGTISYSYSSENGYLAAVTNANNQTITYTYNDQGQLTIIAYGTESIHYGYDVLGRITTVTDNEGTTRYYYDSIGNLVETEYPNGVVTTYTYNENSILVLEETTDSTDTVIASYSYVIGDNNERLSVTELNRTVEYEYDNLNRLISETVTINGDSTVTTYSYDANSNRITMVRDGIVTNYTYNNLNQLITAGNVTYTWDNAGNLISQSSNGVLVATYTYDSYNRMVTASVVNGYQTIEQSYTYDYLGNRTSKTNNGETTNYLTDLSTGYAQIFVETTGNEEIFYTRGLELISRRTNGEAQYYLFDGGSSVRGLTDEDGVITDTYLWDAFGNSEGHTGNSSNEYGFQGEQQDETGLYYLRARYMNPATGTFTSMDTYGGSLSDPMSLHKYMFANANPVKYCDPSGHMSLLELGEAMAIGATLSAAEFELLAFISIGIDEKYGTNYSSSFTDDAFIFAIIIGAITGGFGYPVTTFISYVCSLRCSVWNKLLVLYFIAMTGTTLFALGQGLKDSNDSNDPLIGFFADFLISSGEMVTSSGIGGIFQSSVPQSEINNHYDSVDQLVGTAIDAEDSFGDREDSHNRNEGF